MSVITSLLTQDNNNLEIESSPDFLPKIQSVFSALCLAGSLAFQLTPVPAPYRTIEPRRVSRLLARGKARRAPPFTSLDEVGCHTLTNIIHQLADLSRLATDVFLGIELEAAGVIRRSCRLQGRLRTLQTQVVVLDHKKVQIPVSNLDEESKWTVHYTAPWHQQENVFLPGSRPACVEDLHREAKVNLKSALRECDKLRKDGFRSSQYYSQAPIFSDTSRSAGSLHDDDDDDKKSLSSSGGEDDRSQPSTRPQTPSDKADEADAPPRTPTLPTPEERMRQTALAVPTDIVPINISAAKGHGGDPRPHSMFIPGQYSTLGRVGSVHSALRRSRTRDSGCQTEEVKVVQPSVRKIRAKRGQGIAAQMAGISTSSSTGSLPLGDGHFNSLPRRGARVSLGAEPLYSSTPVKREDDDDDVGAIGRRIAKLRVDDTAVHARNAPRTARPRSQEVRRTRSDEWRDGPAGVASPQAAYSTSFLPDATLSASSEVAALRSRGRAASGLSPVFDTPERSPAPRRSASSGSCAPGSAEASSRTTTDSGSLYSQDNDGYFTSMHLDSGLRARGRVPARHSMYEWRETAGGGGGPDHYGERSLSRSISLRKCKKPPPPPARTDSLRRKAGPKKPPPDGALDENLLASLQRSLRAGLQLGAFPSSPSSPPRSPGSDYEDPWVPRPRSRSSAGSSAASPSAGARGRHHGVDGASDVYSLCPVTPAHSDTSSLRSDYAESWGYYAEYPPRQHTERTAAEGPEAGVGDGGPRHEEPDGGERRRDSGTAPQEEELAAKGKSASPERTQRLTSPSSGYSSQSNTPTAGTPVPSGVRSASPSGGRPRPRVPERKSSLISSPSASSSSTSLSSNTSDSLKSGGPPPPSSAGPTPLSTPSTPSSPPPPFPTSPAAHANVDPLLRKATATRRATPGCSASPDFPPPPSPKTLLRPGTSLDGSLSPPAFLKTPPLPPPPPPPPLTSTSGPPPMTRRPRSAIPVSPTEPPAPLITASALRSVRLRSVRGAEAPDSYPAFPDEKTTELSEEPAAVNGSPEKRSPVLPNGPEAWSPVKQRPPVVAKKPRFLFILPAAGVPPSHEDGDTPPPEAEESEEGSEASTAEIRDDSASASAGSDGEPFPNGGEDEDGSTASSKEDDAGDIFDCNGQESSPALSLDGTAETGSAAAPTPAAAASAARTTEDLFAAIHRSKREVLGRKKSEEDKARSPPTTPPRGSPTSSSRPSGSIRRQLRKSSTSSDTFKALLLKKGSRPESGFRISAAEMLRSTDPRSRRTRSDPGPPESPSPPRSPRASPFPGCRETPPSSSSPPPPSSAFKHGRSRTPPSAASSKYNARCRLLSSPMTVICEHAEANGTLADDVS
ncbi:NHS-like protein 1 isoform X2 [Stigmatopora argus]